MKAIILTGLLMLPFVSVTSALASTPVYNSKTGATATSPMSAGGCSSCADSQSQPAWGSQCSKCSG
jgi:hypothetical protein